VEAKTNRDTKPGSRTELDPVFRLGLTKAKMGMTWILIFGGKIQDVYKPPQSRN